MAQPNHGSKPQGTPKKIIGIVVDNQGESLPYANIALYKNTPEGERLIKGVATNDIGEFELTVMRAGQFILKIDFLAFQQQVIKVDVENPTTDLGKIALTTGNIDLEEVTVQGERTTMQLALDKRVFTIGKDLTNTGNSASEILDNIPSVEVDIDGNVSLRGSQNVRVLVDGKPSGLVGLDGTSALRQMQGNLIEKVEVITNPSARYDAEGEVGIINIVLKKEKKKGVNGSFEVKTGWPHNHGISYNLNYRRKKVNLFSSFGFDYRKNPGFGDMYREFTNEGITSITETDRTHERGGLSNNLRLGMDYFINKTNTLTGAFLFKHSNGNNTANITYKDFDNLQDYENGNWAESYRADDEKEVKQDYELNLVHEKKFKKKGHTWTSDFKWMRGDDTENNEIIESYNYNETSNIDIVSNIEDQQSFIFQSDYVQPLKKDGKFEAGIKGSFRTIINDYLGQTKGNTATEFTTIDGLDNEFQYQENIYAAYASFGNKWKKLSYQFGLRVEISDINTKLLNDNYENPRNYIDPFPTAHFSYTVTEKSSLQLSYSRRLSRPGFRSLLPFFTYSDDRNRFSGNPNLNPEYTHSTELGHLHQWDKGSILTSVYYRYRTGVIERLTAADTENNGTFTLPFNISTQHAVGIEFNWNYSPTKWWRLNTNFNLFRSQSKGKIDSVDLVIHNLENLNFDTNQDLSAENLSWMSRVSSKWSIKKKLDIQTSFNYRAPVNYIQGKIKARYNWDIGASTDVLKGKGTLTFNIRDVLNSRKRIGKTIAENYYSDFEFQWRSRQFSLSFVYRLNQKKKRGGGRPGGYNQG